MPPTQQVSAKRATIVLVAQSHTLNMMTDQAWSLNAMLVLLNLDTTLLRAHLNRSSVLKVPIQVTRVALTVTRAQLVTSVTNLERQRTQVFWLDLSAKLAITAPPTSTL